MDVRKLGADIVFLQEVLGHTGSHKTGSWDEPQYAYGRTMVYPKGHHGNAVMSKFPIVHCQNHDVSVAGPCGAVVGRGPSPSVGEVEV